MLRTVFELAIIAAVSAADTAWEVEQSFVVTTDGWTLPLYRIVTAEADDAGDDAEEAGGDAGEAGDVDEVAGDGGDGGEEGGDDDDQTPPEDVQDGEEGEEDDDGNRRRLSAPVGPVVSNLDEKVAINFKLTLFFLCVIGGCS